MVARARAVAAEPYRRPLMKMTEPFADLKYDQFRAIRFRDEKRLFTDGGRGFQMDLMPPGFYFQDRIEVNLVANGVAQPIAFSTDFFAFHPDYFPYPDGRAPAGLAADMGFSGIRFRHPINRPGVWDEVAVFQGASYFRAVAHDTFYGLSARGLAIGTAGPEGEEFPIFTAFWVYEPQPGDRVLHLSALLDSDSVAGAFDFTIEPGDETVMQVRAVLFPRRDDRPGRHRAADLDVLLRPRAPRRRRRLPRRGARQRRPQHGQRLRRAAVAAAAQSRGESRPRRSPTTTRASFGLIQRARELRALRGRRGALRAAPERLGRAGGRLGPRRGDAGGAAERRRVHRQHRRLLAPGRAAGCRAPSNAFAYRLTWGLASRSEDCRWPRSSPPAAASRSSTPASGSSSSTSTSA